MKFRCSNCATVVDDSQVKCHGCGAVFHGGNKAANILGALIGNRPIEEIKEDWVFEIRKAIVGGAKKTFGVGDSQEDTFKEKKHLAIDPVPVKPEYPEAEFEVIDEEEYQESEIIDIEFEVIDTGAKPKQKATLLDDLPEKVRDALSKRMNDKDEPSNND